jgi:DNA-binding CsgD family transcriptional regulator
VYGIDTLTDEVSLDTAKRSIAMGGEVRLSGEVPMKMVLFDSSTAIMPLRNDDPALGSLVLHWPTLLHALRALFENLWTHGAPLAKPRTGSPEPPAADGPGDRAREILRLLSLGMKDDAIARVLGVSRRTVQKCVSELGHRLGARTRFQIALLAREHGWLDPRPPVQGRGTDGGSAPAPRPVRESAEAAFGDAPAAAVGDARDRHGVRPLPRHSVLGKSPSK